MEDSNELNATQEATIRNNIVAVFDEDFPEYLLKRDKWPSDKCWYCEENEPDKKASRVAILAKRIGNKQGESQM